jgi:hypothetical protein
LFRNIFRPDAIYVATGGSQICAATVDFGGADFRRQLRD